MKKGNSPPTAKNADFAAHTPTMAQYLRLTLQAA
jgi:hypothetical protein